MLLSACLFLAPVVNPFALPRRIAECLHLATTVMFGVLVVTTVAVIAGPCSMAAAPRGGSRRCRNTSTVPSMSRLRAERNSALADAAAAGREAATAALAGLGGEPPALVIVFASLV